MCCVESGSSVITVIHESLFKRHMSLNLFQRNVRSSFRAHAHGYMTTIVFEKSCCDSGTHGLHRDRTTHEREDCVLRRDRSYFPSVMTYNSIRRELGLDVFHLFMFSFSFSTSPSCLPVRPRSNLQHHTYSIILH